MCESSLTSPTLCQWRVWKKGQEANPYEDYREFPSVFCLKINHGGTFTPPPMTRYKGGKVNWVDDIDSDTFSIVEVTSMLQELGYENPCMAYYYKKPNLELENGLVELVVDKDVYEMLMKWELSGIPCTHAVASIWDQANNGIDTGIPESYCLPVHWLTTWKEMYKFKINPVNGPQGWKKSDVPTTIIPPKPHPQIGRPPKKRKKSAAELADEMMKSKKLTKTGKSVTCKSCKQVGHNSRGCKSKKGGGSQQAGVAGHGDAAHGSQQAGVHGSQTTQSTPQAS
ncbi:mutator type transposase [Tanacetum coccineum]|uniref:Mutator type transposase n=1 Tax=Tanacetum coccineum TaxID=301880 RepID=A0ABQ4ZCK3_9ASTR